MRNESKQISAHRVILHGLLRWSNQYNIHRSNVVCITYSMGNTDILGDEISTGWDRILIIETRRRAVDTVCARIYHVSCACGGAGCGPSGVQHWWSDRGAASGTSWALQRNGELIILRGHYGLTYAENDPVWQGTRGLTLVSVGSADTCNTSSNQPKHDIHT